jgi:hypothetical protein
MPWMVVQSNKKIKMQVKTVCYILNEAFNQFPKTNECKPIFPKFIGYQLFQTLEKFNAQFIS